MIPYNERPHLVLFDIDGTLADTHHVASQAYLRAAQQCFSIDPLDVDWGTYTSSTATGIAREITQNKWGRTPLKKELDTLRKAVFKAVKNTRIDAIPGSVPLIERLLKDNNYAVGIATGNFLSIAEHTLKRIGIPNIIPLATADEHPEREGIITLAAQKALSHTQASSFRAITYVGDGAWDCRAAYALGHDFIGIGSCTRMQAVVGQRYVHDFLDHTAFMKLLKES
jgi:phosphoglycolate phosphatase-like HAD superfamily hydrolase